MNQAVEKLANRVCPRCRSKTTDTRSTSPVAGVWTVFGCNACFYTWRSTEPDENTNPDKYPEPFRLKQEELESFPVAPTVSPPARQDASRPVRDA
jgi:vanillate/4-hydroxybenzoate decarboxylase subunit D